MSSIASWRKISVRVVLGLQQLAELLVYHSPVASAFWKIVGFEVTPTIASSFIRRAKLARLQHLARDRVDPQARRPPRTTHAVGLAILHLLLHRCDFLNRATYRSPPSKRAPRKARTSSTARLGADHLGAEAEHVHVVVLDALVSE